MYAGAPLVFFVHAIQPDEVFLGMTGYLHAGHGHQYDWLAVAAMTAFILDESLVSRPTDMQNANKFVWCNDIAYLLRLLLPAYAAGSLPTKAPIAQATTIVRHPHNELPVWVCVK